MIMMISVTPPRNSNVSNHRNRPIKDLRETLKVDKADLKLYENTLKNPPAGASAGYMSHVKNEVNGFRRNIAAVEREIARQQSLPANQRPGSGMTPTTKRVAKGIMDILKTTDLDPATDRKLYDLSQKLERETGDSRGKSTARRSPLRRGR